MDLATRPHGDPHLDGSAVREMLIDALSTDEDGDGFRFAVAQPVDLKADLAGRGGWRFSVESRLARARPGPHGVAAAARSRIGPGA
jgi:hypothetical protein